MIESHREIETIGGGIERLKIEDADFGNWRVLHCRDQGGQIQRAILLATRPAVSVAISTCSRLRSGSASMPARVSRLVVAVLTRSPKRSPSARMAADGGANDFKIEIGVPVVLPGV